MCISTRHPELNVGVWRGRVLPGFSCLALLSVLVLAVVHFDVLTGASKPLSYSLVRGYSAWPCWAACSRGAAAQGIAAALPGVGQPQALRLDGG